MNVLKFSKMFLKYLKIYQLNIVNKINKDCKTAGERNQNHSKKEKKKTSDMVVNFIKGSKKMKNESFLSMEQILKNEKNHFIMIIKNYCFKK